MAADTCQFVDSIASSPTVRLDLNDDNLWGLKYEGTDFSPPPLNRQTITSLLRDGELVPGASYGNRVVRLQLDLTTSTVDAATTELQKLHRELDRPSNFLRWQPVSASSPVFFRTLRSPQTRVVERPGAGTLRHVVVEALAEPFAVGLPTTLSLANVSNDPAAVSNPMYVDISSVKGDVSAPMKIVNGGLDFLSQTVVLATRRRGTVANTPFLLQAEAMTQGLNTTTQANDPTASGAGQNYSRCTFGTATMQTRLEAIHPGSSTVDARGTYHVFGRFRKTNGAAAITVELHAGPGQVGGTALTISSTVLAAGTDWQMVDMGLVQIPSGMDAQYDGPSGVELSAAGILVQVAASRSGSGSVDIDYLLFAPADDQLAIISFGAGATGDSDYVVDSANDAVYSLRSGAAGSSVDTVVLGALPTLRPGVTNRLFLLRDARGQAAVNLTSDLTITYWPRYLYIRPATT